MRITQIATTAIDRLHAAEFYHDVLGLPVRHGDTRTEISIGFSELVLTTDPQAQGHGLHLAFDIPAARIDAAALWLDQHLERLSQGGDDVFDGPAGWNSRSLYFLGPEGSILEFIGRGDLTYPTASGPFHPAEIISISEVGVAVESVSDTVELLSAQAGLTAFGEGSDTFSPVGAPDGLLIIVRTDRVWFPTESHTATPVPLHIEATGGTPGVYAISPNTTLKLR